MLILYHPQRTGAQTVIIVRNIAAKYSYGVRTEATGLLTIAIATSIPPRCECTLLSRPMPTISFLHRVARLWFTLLELVWDQMQAGGNNHTRDAGPNQVSDEPQ